MNIGGAGRWVFWAQWVFVILGPFWVFLGRGLVGVEVGWWGFIGILFGIPIILVLLVPPVLTLFDRDVRRARATRAGYGFASAVLWFSALIAGLSVPDGDDVSTLDPALTLWFGITYDAVSSIFAGCVLLAFLAWFAVVALAVAGIVVSGRGAAPAARVSA